MEAKISPGVKIMNTVLHSVRRLTVPEEVQKMAQNGLELAF